MAIAIIDMIKAYLYEHNLDGLADHHNCGCGLDDFVPCGDGPFPECSAASRHIVANREEANMYDCDIGDIVYKVVE